jgi:putative phosphoesterase
MALAAKLERRLLHGDRQPAESGYTLADGGSSDRTGTRQDQEALVAPVQLWPMKIGVVSDTHGLLRPEVIPALVGVEHILHLGDVGDPEILKSLETVAPVTAIRGNVDRSGPCSRLPATEVVLLEGRYIYMLHDVHTLHLDPAAAKFAAVLYGHSHQPGLRRHKGVLYFNPGSCGPRRFELPVTIGTMTIEKDADPIAEIVHLDCA